MWMFGFAFSNAPTTFSLKYFWFLSPVMSIHSWTFPVPAPAPPVVAPLLQADSRPGTARPRAVRPAPVRTVRRPMGVVMFMSGSFQLRSCGPGCPLAVVVPVVAPQYERFALPSDPHGLRERLLRRSGCCLCPPDRRTVDHRPTLVGGLQPARGSGRT